MKEKIYDILIVGSGPAGLTAAIYGKRAGLEIAIIESKAPGGKLINTHLVNNYPGVKEMSGADLAMNMFQQIQDLKVEFIQAEVLDIKDGKNAKTLVLNKQRKLKTKTVVIATGLVDRKLNIPGEDEFFNKGLSYCAVCDGPIFRGKEVVLIGGGNSAVEESIFASKFASKVYVMNISDKFIANKYSIDEMNKVKNIEPIFNASIQSVEGSDHVEKITYKKDNKIIEMKVAGVFPYIGYIPTTGFVSKIGVTDKNGYIVTDNKMKTKVDGIYAAGDCRSKDIRQVTTAVGDGTTAVQNIIQILNSL